MIEAYYAVTEDGELVVTAKDYFDRTGCLDEDTDDYEEILDVLCGLGCIETVECCFELPDGTDVDALVAMALGNGIDMTCNPAILG